MGSASSGCPVDVELNYTPVRARSSGSPDYPRLASKPRTPYWSSDQAMNSMGLEEIRAKRGYVLYFDDWVLDCLIGRHLYIYRAVSLAY